MMTLLEEEKGDVGKEGEGEEEAKGKEREGGEGEEGNQLLTSGFSHPSIYVTPTKSF